MFLTKCHRRGCDGNLRIRYIEAEVDVPVNKDGFAISDSKIFDSSAEVCVCDVCNREYPLEEIDFDSLVCDCGNISVDEEERFVFDGEREWVQCIQCGKEGPIDEFEFVEQFTEGEGSMIISVAGYDQLTVKVINDTVFFLRCS